MMSTISRIGFFIESYMCGMSKGNRRADFYGWFPWLKNTGDSSESAKLAAYERTARGFALKQARYAHRQHSSDRRSR